MAKSKKDKTDKDQSKAEEIVETVETEAEAVAEDLIEDAADTSEDIVAGDVAEDTVELPEEADVVEEELAADSADEDVTDAAEIEDDVEEIIEDLDETEAEAPVEEVGEGEPVEETSAAEPQIIRETTVEKKSGFMSTALGGVVAAALGFGAAQFTDIQLPFGPAAEPNPFEAEARTAIKTQGEQIATLVTQVDETKKAVGIIDLTPVTTSIAGIEDAISGTEATLKAMGDELAGFDSRLTAIEKAPLSGAVSPESIAAYERELDALRKSITDQQAALDAQKVEIQKMAADAVAAESNAKAQATLAASRAALAQVTSLVQSGKSFAEPLAVLGENGVAVPEALSAVAADGVPTLASLTTSFPDVARKALAVARKSGGDSGEESGGGFASFLQSQLGARSVTPREGNDADAVLSRAEAAVKSGDLETATTELAALPEAALAELGDWLAQAALRKDALAAAATLAQELNKQ